MCRRDETSGDFEIQLQNIETRKESHVSWVDIKGVPDQDGFNKSYEWESVLASESIPDLQDIRLRDPDTFVAGGLHINPRMWGVILKGHPQEERIFDWIQNKVCITQFASLFEGSFKGCSYKSSLPPRKSFPNHSSCHKFSEFVSNEILKRVKYGAVRLWGKVGTDVAPRLVLPLTVEPTKPRLCLDARFLNLWMKDMPFTLDKLADVPRYVYRGSYMTKCDDKSGYDHVSLDSDSQTYVGFQWKGFWFVCTTLPFGWKISPYIYHTIGSAATGFFRSIGIPCSLYIDDRLNGEMMTASGPWSVLLECRDELYRRNAATAALWCVLIILVQLGYTIGISKSVLCPTTSLEYLGFEVDSVRQCFHVPKRKISSWALLRESILSGGRSVNVKTLQRFQGKCISFALAVPAVKLFIREISRGISRVSPRGLVQLSQELRSELEYWRFLDTWQESVPWRREGHIRLSLSTDASGHAWGGVIHLPTGDQTVGDYWDDNERTLNIATKELLSLTNTVEALPAWVKNCRLDASVDSKVLIGVWEGQGSKKSPELTRTTKRLFGILSRSNLQLQLSYVKSSENEADAPSRRLSPLDSKLSEKAWGMVEEAFGGLGGHTIDLMSLDSNVVRGQDGCPLPHFTPHPSVNSQGVNLFAQDLELAENMSNPYVFPPFGLIGPVLRYLLDFKVSFTIVVPEWRPLPYWWPGLVARSRRRILLGKKGDLDTILSPSRDGFRSTACDFNLWAFRVTC